LATLPLVVWWHVRRRRQPPRPVAALFLWEEAQRDAQRQRRWRPTWSLLLQLLAVAAASLALAQPSLSREGPPDVVLIIDAGASMLATQDGVSRLDRAREVAVALMAEASAVALLRSGAEAELLLPFTRDRAELLEALANLQGGDAAVQREEAVALALAIAGGAPVVFISDDPGPPRAGVQRINVADEGRNVGIVALDLGIGQAFVAVASNHPRPVSVEVILEEVGAGLLARSTLLVPAQGRASISFPLTRDGVLVRASIEAAGVENALALDDVAFAGRSPLRVVMDQDEPSLRRALNAVTGVEVQVSGTAPFVAADLRVVTALDPDRLRSGSAIVLAPPSASAEATLVADWARSDPLMRFVDLRETRVALAPLSVAAPGAPWWQQGGETLEAQGWRVLARSADLRPIFAVRERGAELQVRFFSHTSQGALIYRTAFPTLIANLVEMVQGSGRVATGTIADDGSRLLEPGLARVAGRGVVVNLLDERATRLPAPAPDDSGAQAPVWVSVNRPTPVAQWLLLLVFLALLIEWWPWALSSAQRGARPEPRPGLRSRG
jgi:hypothetical protein